MIARSKIKKRINTIPFADQLSDGRRARCAPAYQYCWVTMIVTRSAQSFAVKAPATTTDPSTTHARFGGSWEGIRHRNAMGSTVLRQKVALVQLAKTLLLWRNAVQRVLSRAAARGDARTHIAKPPLRDPRPTQPRHTAGGTPAMSSDDRAS